MRAILSRIIVYPIKSLDGHPLRRVAITIGGSLQHDRELALEVMRFDANGTTAGSTSILDRCNAV